MKKRFLALTLLFGSIWQISNAQLNVSGEFRTRSVVDHGYSYPMLKGRDPEIYLDQRSRIKLDYFSDKFLIGFTLQDARMWGGDDMVSKAGAAGSSNALGVYESWVSFKLTDNSNIKVGRQEWNYDDMRILSYRDWLTSGQSYDGILYQLRKNKSTLDIGLSYNNNGNTQGKLDNSDWQAEKLKTMNFVHFKHLLGEKTSLAVIASLSGKIDTSNNHIVATGTHGFDLLHNYGKKGIDGYFMRLSGYYQHGTDVNRGSDGLYKSISAYLMAVEMGVRTCDKKLELRVGAELISGHNYKNTDPDYANIRHSFDTQYGAILPYYGGYMNHFIFQDSYKFGTKGGGYVDPFIKAGYSLNKKSKVEASVFMPYLTTAVKAHNRIDEKTQKPAGVETDIDGKPIFWKGSLGTYFDLGYSYQLASDINLKAGFSYALVSDMKNQMVYGYKNAAEKQLHELGQNYFGWVMITVKPVFLNSKK